MSSTKSLFAGLTVIASLSLSNITNASNQIQADNHVISATDYHDNLADKGLEINNNQLVLTEDKK